MKNPKAKLYDAGNGRKVTIPENDESELFAAVREQLSPEAVAIIITYLQPARSNNPEANRQVRWFMDELTNLLGGVKRHAELMDELGL